MVFDQPTNSLNVTRNPSLFSFREIYLKNKVFTELKKSQWLPRKDIEELQLKRIRVLLKHAYESVPYYNRIFNEMGVKPGDIRSIRDFSKLPILRKEEVRRHTEEMISSKYELGDLHKLNTSGSTSLPLQVYNCREQRVYGIASTIRNFSWMNVKQEDMAAYIGPPRTDPTYWGLTVPEFLCLYSWEITREKLDKLTNNIRRLKPNLLMGFPSGLSLLTGFCEKRGIRDITFKSILCSGDKTFVDEKKRMTELFHSEVYDKYGAIDAGTISYDCSHHVGLHICSEYMLIEFLREGERAAEKETASVVVTPLFSYGMPLIRYELGDAAHWINDACPCGRGLPLMSYVDGRIRDIIVSSDGTLMCDSVWKNILEKVDIQQFRIIQEKMNSITIELVPGKTFSDHAEKFIITSVKKYMGQEVDVSIKLNDEIQSTPSGKRRMVISHVPIKI